MISADTPIASRVVPAQRTRTSLSIPVLLLALALFFYPASKWGWDVVGSITVSYGDAFLVAALLALLCNSLIHGEKFYLIGSTLLPLAWLILGGVGTIYANDSLAGAVQFLNLLIALYLVPYTVCWVSYSRPNATGLLLTAWLGGCVFSALVAVLGSRGHSFAGFSDPLAMVGHRAYGLTWHPNLLAYCSTLGIMAAWHLINNARSSYQRGLGLVSIGILLYSIMVSGSRAAALALVPATLLLVVYGLRKHWNQKAFTYLFWLSVSFSTIVLAILLVPTGSIAGTSLERFQPGNSGAESSNIWRQDVIKYALQEIDEKPILGSGYELINLAHNNILQVLQCGGIVAMLGVLLWGYLMLSMWRYIRLCHKLHGASELDSGLLVLIQAAVLVWFVVGLFAPFLTDRNAYIMFGMLLSLYMKQFHSGAARP